jgi:hypothetical protein
MRSGWYQLKGERNRDETGAGQKRTPRNINAGNDRETQ